MEEKIAPRDRVTQRKAVPADETCILGLSAEGLRAVALEAGEKAYRGDQVFSWLHTNGVSSFAEMNNVPAAFRQYLSERYPSILPVIRTKRVSALDGTVKYLFSYPDGALVESVLMKYSFGYTLCVSSQVGCRMGCAFCASGLDGLMRNLTAGEILGELYAAEREENVRVSGIVMMGTGEPLDNYDNVLRFIRLVTDKKGRGLSGRAVTVSTCGLVPMIRRLAEEKLTINLALSLHAPDDDKRKRLMPVAKRYTVRETVDAMRYYGKVTGRRLTFEYALVKGSNDADADADRLAQLLRGTGALVNLIPVNPVTESGLAEPSGEAVRAFKKRLEKNGINVTIRREMGRDIEGACGQLRRHYLH